MIISHPQLDRSSRCNLESRCHARHRLFSYQMMGLFFTQMTVIVEGWLRGSRRVCRLTQSVDNGSRRSLHTRRVCLDSRYRRGLLSTHSTHQESGDGDFEHEFE